MRKPIINVCGAVIRRGSKILICGRAPGTKLAGYKEFPGGKAEPGETLSECLRREIREELGTEIYTLDTAYQAWVELPDRIFHLHPFRHSGRRAGTVSAGKPEHGMARNGRAGLGQHASRRRRHCKASCGKRQKNGGELKVFFMKNIFSAQ